MLHLARWAKEHTGEDRLALAGGVALNAKANMVIHYAKLFNDLFIFPAANDAGTPIGAAAWVYEHVLGGKMKMCEVVPVVCHVDQTARPQTVSRDENKTWYELIKAFKD